MKHRSWNEHEDSILRKYYGTHNWAKIQEELPTRTLRAIQCRAQFIDANQPDKRYEAFGQSKSLYEWSKDKRCKVNPRTFMQRVKKFKWSTEKALSTPPKCSRWTDKEIEILGRFYGKKSWPELLQKLPRHTRKGIWAMATKQGFFRDGCKWTEQEMSFLKKHFYNATWERLLKGLPGRTEKGIRLKAHGMGLKREKVLSNEGIEMGKKFGSLTVISLPYMMRSGKRKRKVVRAKCKCGREKHASTALLMKGNSQSCGYCRKAGRLMEGWGETKNMSEWARDPRCKVTYRTLLSRILSGITLEEAMTMRGSL